MEKKRKEEEEEVEEAEKEEKGVNVNEKGILKKDK